MKVKDLIKKLEKLNPDAQVIMQKDGEGNGYSPCSGVEAAVYVADSTWSGQVYNLQSTAEDNCLDDDEWGKLKKTKKNQCAVLWPVN